MIRCTPQGICSWNYYLLGPGHSAELTFRWASEQGWLEIDSVPGEVRKHGWASGLWSLSRPDGVVFEAKKLSLFSEAIEIWTPVRRASLTSISAFGRPKQLQAAGGLNCRIAPDHTFTRRAGITGEWTDKDFPLLAFAFWLTALMWKRNAEHSSSG